MTANLSPRIHRHMLKLSDAFVAWVLFLITAAIFMASPTRQLEDSTFTILLSESLMKHQSFTLVSRLDAGEHRDWTNAIPAGALRDHSFMDVYRAANLCRAYRRHHHLFPADETAPVYEPGSNRRVLVCGICWILQG